MHHSHVIADLAILKYKRETSLTTVYASKCYTKISQKRKIREDDIFDDIVSINEPSSSATVHGVVTSLSPMEKGKSCEYFDGSLSDQTANIQFVGFSTSVGRKLFQHQEKNDSVTLSHCQVQQSQKNDNLEVELNPVTAIKKQIKNFF